MDELAKSHFEHDCISFKSRVRDGRQADHLRQGAADGKRPNMPAEDADITLRLWQRLKPRMTAENADARLRAGRPAADPGRSAGWSGAASRSTATISPSSERDFSRRDHHARRQRSTKRRRGPFTIGSPQQLGEVLYERLGLKGGRKGKSGTLFDRRQRAGAAGGARASMSRGWCSTGAS